MAISDKPRELERLLRATPEHTPSHPSTTQQVIRAIENGGVVERNPPAVREVVRAYVLRPVRLIGNQLLRPRLDELRIRGAHAIK